MVVVLPVVAARHARLGLRRRRAVLIDGAIDGQPRKLLAQAARNGHFFVLDRTNGKAIVSTEFVKTNWSLGYDAKGQPIPNPAKYAADRRRARLAEPGRRRELAVAELQPADGPVLRQRARAPSACTTSTIRATTRRAGAAPTAAAGRSRCSRRSTTRPARFAGAIPGRRAAISGILTTAGNLLFTGGSGGLEALDATTGAPLWHSRIGNVTNGPITYETRRPAVRGRLVQQRDGRVRDEQVAARSQALASFQLRPDPDVHVQRHVESDRLLHRVLDELRRSSSASPSGASNSSSSWTVRIMRLGCGAAALRRRARRGRRSSRASGCRRRCPESAC